MSDIVKIQCTTTQAARAETRLAELQQATPDYPYKGTEGADDLLHHGYMLTRLPPEEIAAVVARANEIIAGES